MNLKPLFIATTLTAAAVASASWPQIVDTAHDDLAGHLARDASGNIYMSCNNNLDIVTTKFSNLGNVLWQKTFNLSRGTSEETVAKVLVGPDGSVTVVGDHWNATKLSMLTFRYSSNGDFLWSKTITSPELSYAYATDAAIDANGWVAVTGVGQRASDYLRMIAVYSSNGHLAWKENTPTLSNNFEPQVEFDHSGTLVAMTTIYKPASIADVRVSAFDAEFGGLHWTRIYPKPAGVTRAFGRGLAITANNRILVVGNSFHNSGTGVVMQLDTSGDIEWTNEVDVPSKIVVGYRIVEGSDGAVYAAGIQVDGVWLAKFSSTGQFQWKQDTKCHGSINTDYGVTDIAATSNGYVVISGYHHGFGRPTANLDAFLMKYNGLGERSYLKSIDTPESEDNLFAEILPVNTRVLVTGNWKVPGVPTTSSIIQQY